MFYLEKNDKPNIIEKLFKIIKIKENIMIIPLKENAKEKEIQKIAQKITRTLKKCSKSKKIVLSKELQKENKLVNYLNTYDLEISDGRWLFKILTIEIINYIIKKKNIEQEKISISILINDPTQIDIENIKELAKKYKAINIVTNHAEKFKKVEQNLSEEGIIITITNNKKKSLKKSQIILNIDFSKEQLNKYQLNEEAIIINNRGATKIEQKRFNGTNINNYEIDIREDKKEQIYHSKKYYKRDLYEAELYKNENTNEIKQKIKTDGLKITKLYINNGEL